MLTADLNRQKMSGILYKEQMVEVFKTNVQQQDQAQELLIALVQEFPLSKINFDLDDCDRILRVESDTIAEERIIQLLKASGYQCQVLE